MRKYLILFLLMSLQLVAHGQTIATLDSLGLPHPTVAKSMRYWFDDDSGRMTSSDMQDSHHIIDVSALAEGLHTVNYQIIDDKDCVGIPYSSVFLKLSSIYDQSDTAVEAEKLIYWYDEQEANTIIDNNGGVQMLDVSDLQDGMHTLHYMVVCNDETVTSTYSSVFLKLSSIYEQSDTAVEAKKLIYWYDEQEANTIIDLYGGVQMLDVSALQDGMHTLHYMVVCSDGTVTSAYSSIFLILNNASITGTQESMIAESMRYWFDEEIQYKETELIGGAQSLDVSTLSDGFHSLHYQLVDRTGKVSVPYSGFFLKMKELERAEGENVITRYQYWLNDHSKYVSVDIPNPSNPYQLITLLPIEKAPIRSSSFHFEVKEGEPMIYAKNDIHFRFYDAADCWADDMRTFVDYNVSQKVTDITPLREHQTFERPEENGIKWFSFEAAYGDSIALKCSQAAALQVFDSAGKELYSAIGSLSVGYGGCHMRDDGIYYVAVHDVRGSSDRITLDWKHIDRYALLEYTPNKMSGIGKTILYFKGNGFEYVESVELFNEELSLIPDTFVCTSTDMLARISTAELLEAPVKLSLKIYFNNAEKNDSKTLIQENAVTLEPVNKGDIQVDVITEQRVGDPFPIRVVLKNRGNIGSYGIPLNIAYDNVQMIDELCFVNFDLLTSTSLCQSKEFFTFSDNLLGKGEKGFFMPLLIPYLGPYEELTLVFGTKTDIAHARLNFYAWAGDPWYAPCAVYSGYTHKPVMRASKNDPCDSSESNIPRPKDVYSNGSNDDNDPSARPGEPYDPDLLYRPGEIADELVDLPIGPGLMLRPWLGVGEAIAGIIQGSTRAREDAVLRNLGLDPSDPANDIYRFNYRYDVRSPLDIWNDANPNPFHSPMRTRDMKKAAQSRNNTIDDFADNPCPDPDPNPIDIWIPGDPNEITGYLAESGSHYISDKVVNVGYDIEFENDPEIANASAHHIVVKDTLDARLFDLGSFLPKTIKISGKEIELDGSYPFVRTIDMRPAINVIAELRGDFDKQSGIATWNLISLDPMTMEPTDDIMQGILPVNNQEGTGIGNVTYTINLKSGLADGTEIPNRASIVFDYNDAILTPTWVNIVDAVCPESRVTNVVLQNDSIATICFEGADARSGVWKYALYVQYGEGSSWNQVAETDTTCFDFQFFENIDYGFCVVATDSAGNVEKKVIRREYRFLNGQGEMIEGISLPQEDQVATNRAYDLSGQLIQEEGYRGIIVKNRKKLLKR